MLKTKTPNAKDLTAVENAARIVELPSDKLRPASFNSVVAQPLLAGCSGDGVGVLRRAKK
jgi:hypothetical protein